LKGDLRKMLYSEIKEVLKEYINTADPGGRLAEILAMLFSIYNEIEEERRLEKKVHTNLTKT